MIYQEFLDQAYVDSIFMVDNLQFMYISNSKKKLFWVLTNWHNNPSTFNNHYRQGDCTRSPLIKKIMDSLVCVFELINSICYLNTQLCNK